MLAVSTVPGAATTATEGPQLGRGSEEEVADASSFPQNAGYNPTGTVGALAYHTAEAVVNRYVKKPGPLV
jgi:hypothetical protein